MEHSWAPAGARSAHPSQPDALLEVNTAGDGMRSRGHQRGVEQPGVGVDDPKRAAADDFQWMPALLRSFRWHRQNSHYAFRMMLVLLMLVARLLAELAIGILRGEVELLSASIHGVFDLTLLGFCLLALLVAKMPVPGAYAFGFVRAEVLSAFANSCYLLFLAFTQCTDAMSASLSDHGPSGLTAQTFALGAVNVVTNLCGSAMFHSYRGVSVAYRSSSDMNYHAVWLHLAADSLCNAGVLASSLLIEAGVPVWAAALGLNLAVATALVRMAQPLFMACSTTLLQRIPHSADPELLNRCAARLASVPGCKGSCHQHFWELAPGQIQGQVTLLVEPGADEGAVKAAAARIFDVALTGASQHIVFEARVT
mmetsp:Transcript_5748/g.14753  ORF Transcript_5748/g.14753 Transcript_5748/m.14753 type:complete len:368 (+) Transcript_5748:105-1208(+)|eukprot:jgi/Tetstr1/421732/TSEL_001191.t1